MTTFDKREEGFEKKFALDEELQFKAHAACITSRRSPVRRRRTSTSTPECSA